MSVQTLTQITHEDHSSFLATVPNAKHCCSGRFGLGIYVVHVYIPLFSTFESAVPSGPLARAGRDFGREDDKRGAQLLPAVPSSRRPGPWGGTGQRTKQRGEGEGDGGPSSFQLFPGFSSCSQRDSRAALPGSFWGCLASPDSLGWGRGVAEPGLVSLLLAPCSSLPLSLQPGSEGLSLCCWTGASRDQRVAHREQLSTSRWVAPCGWREKRDGLGWEVRREDGRQRLRDPRVGLGSSSGLWRR